MSQTAVERRLKRAADRHAAARDELEVAIRDARAEDVPLRTIASIVGMSPETVRTIATREQVTS